MTTDNRAAADEEEISHSPSIAGGRPASARDTVYPPVVSGLPPPNGEPSKPPNGEPSKPWRQEPRQDEPPRNLLDLLDRWWASMDDWKSVRQFTVVALALGISAAVILGGLGFLMHFAIVTSAWLPTVLGAAAGSGASGGTYAYIRRCRGKWRRRGKSKYHRDHDTNDVDGPSVSLWHNGGSSRGLVVRVEGFAASPGYVWPP